MRWKVGPTPKPQFAENSTSANFSFSTMPSMPVLNTSPECSRALTISWWALIISERMLLQSLSLSLCLQMTIGFFSSPFWALLLSYESTVYTRHYGLQVCLYWNCITLIYYIWELIATNISKWHTMLANNELHSPYKLTTRSELWPEAYWHNRFNLLEVSLFWLTSKWSHFGWVTLPKCITFTIGIHMFYGFNCNDCHYWCHKRPKIVYFIQFSNYTDIWLKVKCFCSVCRPNRDSQLQWLLFLLFIPFFNNTYCQLSS